MKEANTEIIITALAYCPYCNEEHDVSTCDSGNIFCVCGKEFYWSTVD